MSIIDNAKEIAELIKKYNDQDLYGKIVALREEILGLREENIQLKERMKELNEAQLVETKLVRHGNCYYMREDKNHEYPYCLSCWDYEKRLVSVYLNQSHLGTFLRCHICEARRLPSR